MNFNFLGLVTSCLFFGPYSDAVGRRKALLQGFGIFTLASIYACLTDTIYGMWTARFLQGIGGGCAVPVALATFRDLFDDKKYVQWVTLMGLVLSIAPAFAPTIGAHIDELLSWHYNFILIAGLSLILFTTIVFRVPETHIKTDPVAFYTILQNYKTLISTREFMMYSMISACTLGGLFSFIVTSPFVYLKLTDFTDKEFSYLIGLGVVGFVIGGFLNRQLILRFSSYKILRAGLIITLLGGTLLLTEAYNMPPSGWNIRIFSLFYTFGMAFVFSNAGVYAMKVFPKKTGASASIFNFLELGTAFIFSAVASNSHDGTAWPLCFFTFLGAAFAVLCFIQAPRKVD
jgi:DHA1 family bicyclomycin/chloramphenicol resistance-like MFS transporter